MNCLMQAGPNSTQHFLLPNSRKGRKTTTILEEKLARHHFIEFLVLKEKRHHFLSIPSPWWIMRMSFLFNAKMLFTKLVTSEFWYGSLIQILEYVKWKIFWEIGPWNKVPLWSDSVKNVCLIFNIGGKSIYKKTCFKCRYT